MDDWSPISMMVGPIYALLLALYRWLVWWLAKKKISYYFFGIFVFFASAAPQRPTCSYHANPAGSPTRNDMPDSNPGLQVLQPGALPLSHHIPIPMGDEVGHKYASVWLSALHVYDGWPYICIVYTGWSSICMYSYDDWPYNCTYIHEWWLALYEWYAVVLVYI